MSASHKFLTERLIGQTTLPPVSVDSIGDVPNRHFCGQQVIELGHFHNGGIRLTDGWKPTKSNIDVMLDLGRHLGTKATLQCRQILISVGHGFSVLEAEDLPSSIAEIALVFCHTECCNICIYGGRR